MQVGHRIIRKRIHVRTEHVVPSRCRESFVKRVKANDAAKHEAHVNKSEPTQPRPPFSLGSSAAFIGRRVAFDGCGIIVQMRMACDQHHAPVYTVTGFQAHQWIP